MSARRDLLLLLAVASCALLLGIGGRAAIHAGVDLPHGPSIAAIGRASVALGAPWLVTAWALGAIAATPVRGAVAGGLALALATVAWYALTVATGGRATILYAAPLTVLWGAVALAAGGAFGAAGAAWHTATGARRALLAAPATGALAGEALLLAGEWTGRAAALVLTLEAAAGVVLAVATRRHAPVTATVGAFLLAAAVMAGAEHEVRDALRAAGWAGR